MFHSPRPYRVEVVLLIVVFAVVAFFGMPAVPAHAVTVTFPDAELESVIRGLLAEADWRHNRCRYADAYQGVAAVRTGLL